MIDLRKLFVRDTPGQQQAGGAPDAPDTQTVFQSEADGEGLRAEYHNLIGQQLRRWGIAPDCVTVEVRQIGRAADGLEVFVGMLRLARWQRIGALRVLLGLPLLEAKVRKTVRTTWMADFSHFGGLWLHASEQLSATPALGELRELMLQLTPSQPRTSRAGEPEAPSTLPLPFGPSTQPRPSGAH